jgi:hypothetical protein
LSPLYGFISRKGEGYSQRGYISEACGIGYPRGL